MLSGHQNNGQNESHTPQHEQARTHTDISGDRDLPVVRRKGKLALGRPVAACDALLEARGHRGALAGQQVVAARTPPHHRAQIYEQARQVQTPVMIGQSKE